MTRPRRDPEEVLASIRKLVAREVDTARAREATERSEPPPVPMMSARASAAARLKREGVPELPSNASTGPDLGVEASEGAALEAEPTAVTESAEPDLRELLRAELASAAAQLPKPQIDTDALRDLIREEQGATPGPQFDPDAVRTLIHEEMAAVAPPTRLDPETVRALIRDELVAARPDTDLLCELVKSEIAAQAGPDALRAMIRDELEQTTGPVPAIDDDLLREHITAAMPTGPLVSMSLPQLQSVIQTVLPDSAPLMTMTKPELRALVFDLIREEVRTSLGAKINENIRRIVREELDRSE